MLYPGQPKACVFTVHNVRAMRRLTTLAARLQPEEVTEGDRPSEYVDGPASARVRREGPDESRTAMTCATVGDLSPHRSSAPSSRSNAGSGAPRSASSLARCA